MILTEMVHDARIVRMTRNMSEEHPPGGWEIGGHWEGDTLVVDTTNFTDKTGFRGSRRFAVIERFTRVDDHALLYRFTIDILRPGPSLDRRIHLAGGERAYL